MTGFVPWDRPSPVVDRLGDLRRHTGDGSRYGFTVDDPKLNARGLLHAGSISTIADICIGHTLAASTHPPTLLVTVSLAVSFLGAARPGEWVDVAVQVHKVGRRVATGTATFTSGAATVAHATGMFVPAG